MTAQECANQYGVELLPAWEGARWIWHVHHDIPCEYITFAEYQRRIADEICGYKDERERALRIRCMVPVVGDLPDKYVLAGREYDRAGQEYYRTRQECYRARQEYTRAGQELDRTRQEYYRTRQEFDRTRHEYVRARQELDRTRQEYYRAGQEYDRACQEYDRARQEYYRARQEYNRITESHRDEINLLHGEKCCPACTWNGKELVMPQSNRCAELNAALAKSDRRDRFAMAAMAGIIANPDCSGRFEAIAEDAVKYADACIAELDKSNAKS